MKKIYALIPVLAFFTWMPLSAQISLEGDPASLTHQLETELVPVVELPEFDLESVRNEDLQDEKEGNYPKIARLLETNVPLEQNGEQWSVLETGERVWRQAIRSEGAMALSVQFENFAIPAGSRLFIYTPDYAHQIGAFTEFNNHESGVFSTQLVPGEEVIVEYIEPEFVAGQGQFTIIGAFHAYRMIPEAEAANRDFGDSDPCQVNANCTEGNNWQDQKRGVVRIFVVEGTMGGWCSGSLVNNTAQDCRPFILTALHCGQNATAANMNQWVFNFNYEAPGCNNPFSQGNLANQSMTGCIRRADSGDNGGNNGSDYMLVELNNDVPTAYNPYYNGWRRNNVTSSSGVSIHHPAGDIKKISTYNSSLSSTSWGFATGSHWQVQWTATTNGHGVTEGGSSGSPIFDNQGLIIGTLTGGSSFCSQPFAPDLYGKMSYHWQSNPGDNLSVWLDPVNSGVTSLQGTNQPCNGGGGGDDCVSDIPHAFSDPCVQTVILEDPFCCDTEWDFQCEEQYQECNDNEIPDCQANIPYPLNDPCVQLVINDDPFCCEDMWDEICDDAYIDCNGGGGNDDCSAGNISVSTSQSVCPNEDAIFNVVASNLPLGGEYGIGFESAGGTGGVQGGFTLTGVTLPFEFDNGLNGILQANGLPNLSGNWELTGIVYTDVDNLPGTTCAATSQTVTVNFLPGNHPDCAGAGCAADEIEDCNGNCAPAIWVGDGYCDDGTYSHNGVPIFFNCAQFNNDGGDCDDTSVNLYGVTIKGLRIYPNPASNVLTIAFSGANGEMIDVSILSSHGALVHRSSEYAVGNYTSTIDISYLAAGMYFVRLTTEKGGVTQKLIVSAN